MRRDDFLHADTNLVKLKVVWISMTELFVIMNSFTITEINKNQWIYQWIFDIQIIWKLSYVNLLRIIVFELFEQWTTLIVFLFLVLILSIWPTIKWNNLRKFCSQISEKYDQTSIFVERVLWNQSCSSVHVLPVHPSVIYFSQDLLSGKFLDESSCRIFYKVTIPDLVRLYLLSR